MSQEKILYLGLRAPPGTQHYPVIATKKIGDESAILARWDTFTHGIFTSQTTVAYWNGPFDKPIIAIGDATARAIEKKGGHAILAPHPTQEGVIAMLGSIQGTYFYPRSKKARPLLKNYLEKQEINHQIVDLYDTILQKLEPIPILEQFEQIVFTSPSTVRGFFQIFQHIPEHIELIAIGPITLNALRGIVKKNIVSFK